MSHQSMSPESPGPSVRVERDGPVTTVVIDRPHAPNAVDGPTAAALAVDRALPT